MRGYLDWLANEQNKDTIFNRFAVLISIGKQLHAHAETDRKRTNLHNLASFAQGESIRTYATISMVWVWYILES
jgi:hypothetical protein